MKTITIFTAPKPFVDPHIAVIQRNAIRSWTLLPEAEVMLVGDEPGIAEAARELGARHLPKVACTGGGTPLISSIFGLARAASATPLLAYVNADILLMDDFPRAAERVSQLRREFLIVGSRWDLDLSEPLPFGPGWQEELRALIRRRGAYHPPMGSDYFIFPRACFADIPDFAVGRAGWDNWMLARAVQEGWALVDASPSVTVAHQNHDYSHIPVLRSYYGHPESEENIRLAGGRLNTRFSLADADLQLRRGRLRPARLTLPRALRLIERWLLAHNTPPRRLRTALYTRIHHWRTTLQKAR